jgi:hypothetical protein
MTSQPQRVGELRPNQLLHTYGIGSVADLPNLSVMVSGLDDWNLANAERVVEDRLLAAVQAQLGTQVETLRTPPYTQETGDPFGEWARTGVPVRLFPRWLRCSDTRCNRLAPVETGLFELLVDPWRPERVRYVHGCRGHGQGRPTAVPARFTLACERGHLDEFPWKYYVHNGVTPENGEHTLRLTEQGTTGEAANLIIQCSCGEAQRSMAPAFGQDAGKRLPACRGRHLHLDSFEPCGLATRTLGLGATNGWFAMRLRAFSLPRGTNDAEQRVADNWGQLSLLAGMPEPLARQMLPNLACWPDLADFGTDDVWKAIVAHQSGDGGGHDTDDLDLASPEWEAFTQSQEITLPDFTTRRERPPANARPWLRDVTLVPRLREVSALYGFTRIDAPEWDVTSTDADRAVRLSRDASSWVPCAQTRGEGIFLRFDETTLRAWEQRSDVQAHKKILNAAHEAWRADRRLPAGQWPGMRYVLLHTFAHAVIRELALECGYSASGIAERVYARSGDQPMAGVLLYTAAPDSEGTLGGLVSLGQRDRLGQIIDQALHAARLCSSDPLCAEHDPRDRRVLYGAACHACLFAAETSCERGNHYLDRRLLVDTVAGADAAFLPR